MDGQLLMNWNQVVEGDMSALFCSEFAYLHNLLVLIVKTNWIKTDFNPKTSNLKWKISFEQKLDIFQKYFLFEVNIEQVTKVSCQNNMSLHIKYPIWRFWQNFLCLSPSGVEDKMCVMILALLWEQTSNLIATSQQKV